MSLGHDRNRTRRSRGMDRSPIGKRPPCPRCGATMLPALEVDEPECLRCACPGPEPGPEWPPPPGFERAEETPEAERRRYPLPPA